MVKEQCRYCVELVVGDYCFCKIKQEERSVESCKRRIGCLLFEFCPIDAFGSLDYDSSKYNRKQLFEQLRFDI